MPLRGGGTLVSSARLVSGSGLGWLVINLRRRAGVHQKGKSKRTNPWGARRPQLEWTTARSNAAVHQFEVVGQRVSFLQ